LIKEIYSPAIGHTRLPQQEYNIFRISVDNVIVRYVENLYTIQVTVEGDLPERVVDNIKSDLLEKFSRLENSTGDIDII